MISTFLRLFKCVTGTAAVEAAIFAPLFLTFTLGVTDLGSGMFARMTVNAAAQAGAAYAAINSCTTSCLTAIKASMNDATGNSSFCTGSVVCTASISPSPCTAGSVCVITVSVNYPYSPILPYAVYSWAQSTTVSSTVTIQVQ
jgi:Flp pilus assembly protein TadG